MKQAMTSNVHYQKVISFMYKTVRVKLVVKKRKTVIITSSRNKKVNQMIFLSTIF